MKLQGKVALITGTSPNICGGIAEGMAEEGAKIVCVDIQPDNANLCADDITKRGRQAIGVVCDVTNEEQVKAAVKRAREAFGGVDILVNGAVIFNQKGVLDMPLEEWTRQTAIILTGTFLFTKYVARLMIEQGRKGNIINIHRGAQVCRERAGTAKTFQCAYHAWTYTTQGELVGVPGEEAYSAAFDRSELGLVSAPRRESYRGFVFVSFNPASAGLVTYLAGAREYLDLVCDQSEQGMEIISGTQLYSMRANWKLLVENSIDGYHGLPTHKRYFLEFLPDTGVEVQGLRIAGTAKSLGHGHAVIENPEVPFGRPIADWIPAWGAAKKAELEAMYQKLTDHFGAERAYKIAKVSRNLLIFPNLIINDIMAITVRTFFPLAPDYMEITAWALAPQEESPEDRALRLDNFLTFLGPGGFATPDDVEMLESCQRGYAAVREVQWSDISRGMQRPAPLATDELQMQVFWRRWHELLTRSQPAQMQTQRAAAL